MAKRSDVQRALDQLDAQIASLQQAKAALVAAQAATTPAKKPALVKKPTPTLKPESA